MGRESRVGEGIQGAEGIQGWGWVQCWGGSRVGVGPVLGCKEGRMRVMGLHVVEGF